MRAAIVSVVLGAVVVSGVTAWLLSYDDFIAVQILAPADPAREIPIYARHVITQTLRLSEELEVTGLTVPLAITDPQFPVHISLKQDNRIIHEWEYQESQPGAYNASFSLIPPVSLGGIVEVRIAAENISDARQTSAPRVMIDPDDAAYPDGNYRIAQNEKKGDMALTVWARQHKGQQLVELGQQDGWMAASFVVRFLLVFVLLVSLPPLIWYTQRL